MKRFIVEYDGWQAEFDVDVEQAAPACKERLGFFSTDDRSEDKPEEIVHDFLELWAPIIAEQSIRLNIRGVTRAMGDMEGCIPLDGSQGIKIVHCDSWEWSAGFSISSGDVSA